ncbi:unnamed protein product [Cylicocyclus nassatus]|uniref:Uncharacterized protein n=1 Tax=Cylicocyclus nassatus TaxID=53992 RepID=A0AA36DTZ4_CYLNA|nr:unnamed protein product [Cylicocyclus nassatus]
MSRLEMRITNAAACGSRPRFLSMFIRHGRSFANQSVNYITLHDFVICLVGLLERDHNENFVVANFSRQLTRLVEKLDTKHSKSFCQM